LALYQSPTGTRVDIKNEEGKLALYFSSTNKYVLYTASETDFYATSEFFNLRFKEMKGQTKRIPIKQV
jgi:hypothetical protein